MKVSATVPSLSSRVVARRPIDSQGYSGNPIELVTLEDGSEFVCKRVSPDWDWLSRATADDGRLQTMWSQGVFDRMPPAIEHATVAVEGDAHLWRVFMRDVSAALLPADARLGVADIRRILSALADLHAEFEGYAAPLCSLEQRYGLLSLATAERELALGNAFGATLRRGWEAFYDQVPDDVGDIVRRLVADPAFVCDALRARPCTLIHGDVRAANIGFTPEAVVLIDWGERTGIAPPAVDFAWFLGFDARRVTVSRDELVRMFADACGYRFDAIGFELAMIGGLLHLAGHFGLGLVFAHDDAERGAAAEELEWWVARVRRALEAVA